MAENSDVEDFTLKLMEKVRARNEKIEETKAQNIDGKVNEILSKLSTPISIPIKPVRGVRFQIDEKMDEKEKELPLGEIDENKEMDFNSKLEEKTLDSSLDDENDSEEEDENKNSFEDQDESTDKDVSESEAVELKPKGFNIGIMSVETKKNLTRLGQLYGDSDKLNSPVHAHSELEKTLDPNFGLSPQRNLNSMRKSRLNSLAASINNWEDELPTTPAHNFKMTSPKKSVRSSPYKTRPHASTIHAIDIDITDGPTIIKDKNLALDTSNQKTSTSTSLSSECSKPTAAVVPAVSESVIATNPPNPTNPMGQLVSKEGNDTEETTETMAQKRARFESAAAAAALQNQKPRNIVVTKNKIMQQDDEDSTKQKRTKFESLQAQFQKPSQPSVTDDEKNDDNVVKSTKKLASFWEQKIKATATDKPFTPKMISPKKSVRTNPYSKMEKKEEPKSTLNVIDEDKQLFEIERKYEVEKQPENKVEIEKQPEIEIPQIAVENFAKPITTRNPHYRPSFSINTSYACRQVDQFINDALEGQDFTMDTINESKLRLAPHASSTPFPPSSPSGCGQEDVHNYNSPNKNYDALVNMKEVALKALHLQKDKESAGAGIVNPIPYSCLSPYEERPPRPISFDSPQEPLGTSSPLLFKEPKVKVQENLFERVDEEELMEDEDNKNKSSEMDSNIKENIDDDEEKMECEAMNEPEVEVDEKLEEENLNSNNLLHTVSFYRRQTKKQNPGATPKRLLLKAICERDQPSEGEGDQITSDHDPSNLAEENEMAEEIPSLNEMIKNLEKEVLVQEHSISQATKALDLCQSRLEFSNSTESVECEKILLIAAQKRTSLKNEISRLQTDAALSEPKNEFTPSKIDLGPSSRGNMTLSDIAVVLKRDFIGKAMRGESIFQFICLVRYRNYFESSSLVSLGSGCSSSNITNGTLYFPNIFTIKNMEPGFQVVVEIYFLETAKEYIPHEAKYHINKKDNKKGGLLTPKKPKGESSRLIRVFRGTPSPANMAVRSSKFEFCGTLTIDLSTLKRSQWNLEKVIYQSPLEKSLTMKIDCKAVGGIEEKGFLTLFDDVSGFGSWERRWCSLNAVELCYWMYPEDAVNQKEPLGSIKLHQCITPRVEQVSPDTIAARKYTFLLTTARSKRAGDKESLVCSTKYPDFTFFRHLMAADSREDLQDWIKSFNKALVNLRAWDPDAQTPIHNLD